MQRDAIKQIEMLKRTVLEQLRNESLNEVNRVLSDQSKDVLKLINENTSKISKFAENISEIPQCVKYISDLSTETTYYLMW